MLGAALLSALAALAAAWTAPDMALSRTSGIAGGESGAPIRGGRLAPTTARNSPSAAHEAAVDALSAVAARKYRISDDAMRAMIGTAFREARRNGLDPVLVVAVMAVESGFNPLAQSEHGAMGLMQVIPRFHADKLLEGEESIFDPRVNIRLGARVLKEYILRAGNEQAGLQLYNGSASDPSNAYAGRVFAERQRLLDAINRFRNRA